MSPKKLHANIVLLTCLLCVIGLLMTFSTTSIYYFNDGGIGNPFNGLYQQSFFLLIGTVVALVVRKMNTKYLKKYAFMFYFISICLLVAVLMFHTSITNEVGEQAKRWIMIPGLWGITMQPSEIAKVAIIFYIASYYSRFKNRMKLSDHIGPLFMIVLGGLLIAIEPNASAALVFGAIGIVTMMLAGLPLMLGVLSTTGFSILSYFAMLKIPRLNRRLDIVQAVYISPDAYQLRQGLRAIVRGGFFGQGFMKSSQKFVNLAFSSTDYIFAIICEEFGLIFGFLLLILYFFLFYYALQIARLSKNHFNSVLVSGIAFHILFQAILHVAVTLAVFLPTGVPLPFISKGGSALVLNLFEIGVILNIAARLPEKNSKKEELRIVQ
ncbi:MAG: FtsW/RodA/SpoVE family cell cycle protein [Caldisericia bacterium]|nr:FtsW/RodA/SpoVE family cell cycle protein [Caldisericia bacterium]